MPKEESIWSPLPARSMTKVTTLPNGVRLVLHPMPHALSVSVGFFLVAGLEQESDRQNGLAHFLEHMVFKGTKNRTAKQIVVEVDAMGAVINAYTSREFTSFYLTSLPAYVRQSIEILSDMVLHATLDPVDVDRERAVIFEEIDMVEDTPDDRIFDLLSGVSWPRAKRGRPVLGTRESLQNITPASLRRFRELYRDPERMVVVVAGQFEPASVKRTVEKYVGRLSKKNTNVTFEKMAFDGSAVWMDKATEQAHVALGIPAPSLQDDDQFGFMVLSTVLGGSMSSRLFQKVRERHGLAYSIFTHYTPTHHAGAMSVYAGVNSGNIRRVLRIVRDELIRIQDKTVNRAELQKAKAHLIGNLQLGLEQTSSWMNWLGKSLLDYGRIVSLDEINRRIQSVEPADLQRLAQKNIRWPDISLALIGPRPGRIPIEGNTAEMATHLKWNWS